MYIPFLKRKDPSTPDDVKLECLPPHPSLKYFVKVTPINSNIQI
jgi:hypothetical protein